MRYTFTEQNLEPLNDLSQRNINCMCLQLLKHFNKARRWQQDKKKEFVQNICRNKTVRLLDWSESTIQGFRAFLLLSQTG